MIIQAANPAEAAELSALAMRSKAHWGYDQAFMRHVRDELTYQPAQLLTNPTFVARNGAQLLGFYQLIRLADERCELEALFVDPAAMGQGVGQSLFRHMTQFCAAHGVIEVVIQSDPFAEGFYLQAGCVRVGSQPSASIPGRELPLLSYRLPANG